MLPQLTALRFPSLAWAHAAIEDLAAAGCTARLLGAADAAGCHVLLVFGPAERISALRRASEPTAALCWASFVNAVIAG